jgi:hypothetical protein
VTVGGARALGLAARRGYGVVEGTSTMKVVSPIDQSHHVRVFRNGRYCAKKSDYVFAAPDVAAAHAGGNCGPS